MTAKEAQAYHDQKKLGEFYATVRDVLEPRSRNTNQIKSKQGKLLTTPDEIKDRWVEYFSDLLIIPVKTDESIPDNLPVKQLIIDGELSKSFAYNGRVKQGCKLASSLFGIYVAILL